MKKTLILQVVDEQDEVQLVRVFLDQEADSAHCILLVDNSGDSIRMSISQFKSLSQKGLSIVLEEGKIDGKRMLQYNPA